ncbi:MAG TPA: NAD(P)-dependent oxidoreductase [Steroidobacteraceae bacterium]|nr:NAD(P)-dependent oxidoreductase [Steroidobacteraceae bacterium]
MSRLVLLTGGLGFVGRPLCAALAAAGARVRLVVRRGATVDVHAALESVVQTPDLFAETTDWWGTALDGVDTVVHAAWYAEPGRYLTSPRNLECLVGTLRLADGAVAAGVRRVVGVGTCFEYDLSAGRLAVTTPLAPSTPYAGAKAAAYLALSTWLKRAHVGFAWARLFYLYGEREDPRRLVPYLRARLAAGEAAELTLGEQVRDFLDVAEAGRQIAALALGTREGPVNVCSGVPTTVRALAERIADEYGRRDLLRFGARPENLVDPPCVVGVP